MTGPEAENNVRFFIGETLWPQVSVDSDTASAPLLTDCPDQLGTVLYELVQNCVQKPHDGNEIRVGVVLRETNDGMYRIEVTDNVTYPEETLKDVLHNLECKKPDQRCRAPGEFGGGLGITMVRNFAGSMGGSLEYEGRGGSVVAVLTLKKDLVNQRLLAQS